MKRTLIACGALTLALVLAGCSQRDAPSDAVTVTADIPAAGLQHLVFRGTTGEAKLGVSPDDAVHVKLVMQQQQRRILGVALAGEATLHDIEGAKVGQDRQGDTLTVAAVYPSGDSHDSDIKVKWTIQVPARFGVDASLKAGRMVIAGVSGGVKAELSAGETLIHVPSGPIDASMAAGRLSVVSDQGTPRKLLVKSTFGLAIMDVMGKYYGPPEEKQDSFRFFGNTLNMQGQGQDDIQLKVTAGLADLRVGPQGDEKEYRDIFAEDREAKIAAKDAKKDDKEDKDDD